LLQAIDLFRLAFFGAKKKKKKKKKMSSSSSNESLPWLEKYRPRAIKDIVGNEGAVDRLQAIARDGNVPNMIISGPPGVGKVCTKKKKHIYTYRKQD
jgi:replication-associated recombination protein RarA